MWKRAIFIPRDFSFCIQCKKERHSVWEQPDATSDIAELVYVQNTRGLWPANESTHAELMPPKLTEGRSGPAAPHWHAHLPMVPGAMPSTLTLPRHAGMLSHSWKQEETGLPAYFSHRVLLSLQQLWNETKQWEMSESSPHSSWVVKAVLFLSTVCCHGWRAAFQSLLASSAMTHHVAC